jgi:hypothetical protein
MSSQVKNRVCVFIDSSNVNQVISMGPQEPIIKIPFPPDINPRDLVVKTKDGKVPTRVPNAFIIYRKIFIETARSNGYYLPMTIISSMASQSWERESEVVKAEYKRLAKEAYRFRNEMLPKSQRKKKREKWNIISFEKEPVKDSSKSKSDQHQFTSPVSSPELQSIYSSPIIPQFGGLEIDFDRDQHMTSNPEISIEEEIINSINAIEFNNHKLSLNSELLNINNIGSSGASSSDTNESSILFDLLMPINEGEFVPTFPEKDLFSPEMLNMYAYNNATNVTNSTNVIYETSSATNSTNATADFVYPRYL